MTSQAKLPFITLKMKPNEYHQLMPTLLDYAKTKGLYDYVVGNEIVKSTDQETTDAANVVRIRKHDYDDIANEEARITPSIYRYHPDTDLTDHDVFTKLTPANRSLAVDKYTNQIRHSRSKDFEY